MASVEFHTGIEDPVGYCCRLLRKAYRRGATVLCLAPRPTLDALDRALWTFDERDFVPHVRVPGAAPALRDRTPIWLAAEVPAGGGREVLVSLEAELPAAAPFARVIEVVGAEPEAAQRGRALWRRYKEGGFAIVHQTAGGREA